MGRGKSTGGFGCLILIGITIWLFCEYPAYAWIGVGLIVLLAVLFARSGTCQVCGVALKKAIYHWEIDGKKKMVCPTCNRNLQSRRSKEAVDKLFEG